MNGIDNSFIEKLKDKLDIVDVIGRYCELKKNGRNFWACCPFHVEKTPSFSVNSIDKYYHCFGCGKSGDIITFIMEIENIDFIDAVKLLAKMANLEVPEVNLDNEEVRKKREKKERLLNLLRESAIYYAKNLRTDNAIKQREYLFNRGLTKEDISRFGLGASTDYDSVITYLLGKGYTKEEMYEVGVAGKTQEGKYFDFLHGRVIIPAINQFGQVIAFCGRMLEKKGMGKYVNTKETPIFSKGNNLFGINILKTVKKSPTETHVILVEGHMDVISLVSAGYENTVASMGTALTPHQAKIIKNHRDNVYLCYDGDEAGRSKAIRAIDILESAGLNVKVVCLPDELDPDDVIKKHGKEAFDTLLKESLPAIDFKLFVLEKYSNLEDIDGKRQYIHNAIKIIKSSNSPSVQEELLKKLSLKTHITKESLQKELDGIELAVVDKPTIKEQTESDIIKYAETVVLYAVIFNKSYSNISDLVTLEFSTEKRHRLVQAIISQRSYSKDNGTVSIEKIEPTMLFESIDDDLKEELSPIFGLDNEISSNNIDEVKLYKDCVKTIKRNNLQQKVNELTTKYKEEVDTTKRAEYSTLLFEKIKELNTLK